MNKIIKKSGVFFSLFTLSLVLWGCPSAAKKTKLPIYLQDTKPVEEMAEIHNKFERMKYQLIGHFSNRQQVEDNNSGEAVQEFIVTPILKDRPGEFWVYLEFFSPNLISRPLDQRVEQYVKIDRDTFRMEVYYLKNSQKYINAWKKGNAFADLDLKEDLIRDKSCDLIIVHNSDKPGTYRTLAPTEVTCLMRSSDTKAQYVDLAFELSDDLYRMWFHFYDSTKKMLKETEEAGLKFRRLNPEDSAYEDLSKKKKDDF